MSEELKTNFSPSNHPAQCKQGLARDRDVTDWRPAQEELKTRAMELERLSLTDPLTGIANRRRMENALASEIVRAQRYGGGLALLYFDLDHFKQVNDVFGHEVGDLFLCQTAQTILQTIRETDTAGRIGGDKFCILAPLISAEQAIRLADRIRARLAREKVYPLDHPLTASFGVAQWKEGESISSLLQRADQLMYQAKSDGRNRICADRQTENHALLNISDSGAQRSLRKTAREITPVFRFLPPREFAGISGEKFVALRAEAQEAASPPPFN